MNEAFSNTFCPSRQMGVIYKATRPQDIYAHVMHSFKCWTYLSIIPHIGDMYNDIPDFPHSNFIMEKENN